MYFKIQTKISVSRDACKKKTGDQRLSKRANVMREMVLVFNFRDMIEIPPLMF